MRSRARKGGSRRRIALRSSELSESRSFLSSSAALIPFEPFKTVTFGLSESLPDLALPANIPMCLSRTLLHA
jgi:hypothetical protein